MASKASLDVEVGLKTAKFQKDFSRFQSQLRSMMLRLGGLIGTGMAARTMLRFNSAMEDARLSLAGLLRLGGQYRDFNLALERSTKMVEQLRIAATETSSTFEDLVGALKATSGYMRAAGIDASRWVPLMVRLSQVVSALGLDVGPGGGYQLVQETRALLTGQSGRGSTLMSALFPTEREKGLYLAALRSGRGYGALMAATAPFSEIAAQRQLTTAGAFGNLQDILAQTLGRLGKDLYNALGPPLLELQKLLQDPAFLRQIDELAVTLGNFARNVLPVVVDRLRAFSSVVKELALLFGVSFATRGIRSTEQGLWDAAFSTKSKGASAWGRIAMLFTGLSRVLRIANPVLWAGAWIKGEILASKGSELAAGMPLREHTDILRRLRPDLYGGALPGSVRQAMRPRLSAGAVQRVLSILRARQSLGELVAATGGLAGESAANRGMFTRASQFVQSQRQDQLLMRLVVAMEKMAATVMGDRMKVDA